MHRDVYSKITPGPVQNFLYDLDVHLYNSKGERIPPEEKTPEQLADLEFRNYVFEMSFQDVEQIQKEAQKKKIQEARIKAQKVKNNPKVRKVKKPKKEEDEYDEEKDDSEEDLEDDEDDEQEEFEEEEEEDELVAVKYDFREEWISQ